jgi:hypothetical protein
MSSDRTTFANLAIVPSEQLSQFTVGGLLAIDAELKGRNRSSHRSIVESAPIIVATATGYLRAKVYLGIAGIVNFMTRFGVMRFTRSL